jgi:methylglutaconyl-CoA hydratase
MEFLKLTSNQNVLRVSLNRPEKRNAFHPGMIKELTQTFAKTLKEKELRAVVLTGEGASFCSGGDLEWMKDMAKYSAAKNLKDASELFKMYWTIRSCPVPVLGRMFGHCFGGGAGLTAVCDIVAAEDKTLFSFSEVKWGLAPAVISPFVMERAQPAMIREWFVTAKVFNAQEALHGGLINRAGTIGDVDFYLEETIKMILNAAPEAVRATKKLHQSYSTINWKKVEPQVVQLIAERRTSQEGQLGLNSFLNKQPSPWAPSPYGKSEKI